MSSINSQCVSRAAAVTPSDTGPNAFTGLYIGGAGNVAVVMAGNTASVTFVGVPAGLFMPIQVSQVLSTGTTASSILGLSA
jgi:hypothetical protein